MMVKNALFSANSLKISAVILMLYLTIYVPVESTVEVLASSGCRLGTVYQPTSCTRCVCGLFNFMLCRQACFASQDELTTSRPSGPRPSGPTIIPILLPFINRRPFNLLLNDTSFKVEPFASSPSKILNAK